MISLKFYSFLIFYCTSFILSSQCSFQYISNDTVFQDYIEFIYSRKDADEIITIGSRINRGIVNDSVYNAPVFQSFDYCGNILNKTIYRYIGNSRLSHKSLPTHNSYQEEPIGNATIEIKDDEFLLVDKGYDTLLKKFVIVIFRVNEKGELKNYKTLAQTDSEANQTIVKNVLELKDGKILIILWDKHFQYFFYYFNENSDFLFKKSFNLGRGIRSIKETDNGEFVCTSLAYNGSTFQFYRLDTFGEIKWIVNPYIESGSAREVQIVNNKIYVTGSLNYGVFLICDLEGNILKEFKFDTFFCLPRFCSAYLDTDYSFVIGGYLQHCLSTDSSGTDVAVIKIDTNGAMLWNKLYDFRNALGTMGSKGNYTDYGGFVIDKANDGGIITNGMSIYRRLSPGGIVHEDALLIKTEPLIMTNIEKKIFNGNYQLELLANLITNNLDIKGPLHLIENWVVYSLNGEIVIHGNKWSGPIDVNQLQSGLYNIKIFDLNKYQYFYKFVKI